MNNDVQILEKLLRIVPCELGNIRPGGRKDCCILATKIALDVLRFYNVPAKPLTVRAFIANAPLVKRFEAGNPPKSFEELTQAGLEDGSHSIGLGYGYTEGKWSGHLVVVSEGWMLDLTLPQVNRPQHGIFFEPILVPVSSEFETGRKTLMLTHDGNMVKYYAFPSDFTFRDAPDWIRISPVVSRVIRQL